MNIIDEEKYLDTLFLILKGRLPSNNEKSFWKSRYDLSKVKDRKTTREDLISRIQKDPSNSYRLWKYVSEDVALKYIDPTTPPHSIRYKNETQPLVQKKNKIIDERGSLRSIEYWGYDYDNNQWLEPVIKLTFIWTFKNDAAIKTAESILYSKMYIQYYREDGTLKHPYTIEEIINGVNSQGNVINDITVTQIESNQTDIKYTYKRFHKEDDNTKPDYELSSKEGKKRRENTQRKGEEGFITLVALLITLGDKQKAERLGKALIRKYSSEYSDYIDNGDSSFIDKINLNENLEELKDPLGIIIQIGVSSKSLLDTVIPSIYPHSELGNIPIEMIVSNANLVSTIREYIVEKYKGEI